jgi:adenosylhomocysteine nucleosidase
LQKRIKPLICGVGPIEAATQLSSYLASQDIKDRPDHIMVMGSSGSAKLNTLDIRQISHVTYRDMDASVLGIEKGKTPFASYDAVLELEPLECDLPFASLSTGGAIVTHDNFEALAEDMADMETYALARVALHFKIPLSAIRCVSDGRAPLKGMNDWSDILDKVDEKLAKAWDIYRDSVKVA